MYAIPWVQGHIVHDLRTLTEFLAENYEECKSLTEQCIQKLKRLRSSDVSNKYELLASLYSVHGNACFELEQYEQALNSYRMDLDVANNK